MAKQSGITTRRGSGSSKGGSRGGALAKSGMQPPNRASGTKVLGLGIPKALTNALDSLVNSPRGREILAAAIVAAASAAAAALVEGSNKAGAARARDAASDAGDRITRDLSEAAAGVVASVISNAAQSLLPALAGKKGEKQGRD
jgi:hypothetical protein